MKIEKLEKSHKKKIIFGGVIGLGVIGIITILPSFAKYKVTQEINIANGVVNYKVPDLKVMAMYKSDDGVNYTEIEDRMPDSGYIINEEKSYCNLNDEKDMNVVLKTINKNHVISNLIKGDRCYLYFDKYDPTITISNIITNNKVIEQTDSLPNFSQIATTDEGVFKTEDGMYGGNSYYFRGAVTTNHVIFANKCWQIIRINGDGSIRLIYNGSPINNICPANDTNDESIITTYNYTINSSSSYVGWTYTVGNQRPTGNETSSNAKTQTENWYDTNLKIYEAKIADGKFCNDRNMANGTWSASASKFSYAANNRLNSNKKPTLNCPNGDIYILKIGAITADEVAFAGGVNNIDNKAYYLYNKQGYWTMTPSNFGDVEAFVYEVNSNGNLTPHVVAPIMGSTTTNYSNSIRPVINLKADTTFSSGDGTLNNPYIVQ